MSSELLAGYAARCRPAAGPRPAGHRRRPAGAVRPVAVPLGADRRRPVPGFAAAGLRRRRLGRARGAGALAAAGLRQAAVHQRPLPVPGRAAARPGREPDRVLPAQLRTGPASGPDAVLRFDGVDSAFTGLVQRDRAGLDAPAAGCRPSSTVGALLRPGREPDRGPGAPVVLGQLPGGPGHVVAVRHLPRGQPAGAAGRRPGRPVRACRLRRGHRHRHADRGQPGAGHPGLPGARAVRGCRQPAASDRERPALDGRNPAAVPADGARRGGVGPARGRAFAGWRSATACSPSTTGRSCCAG